MDGLTRREKLITDVETVREILEKSKVLHLGLVDGDEPYVVPMNYGHTLEDGKLTLWLHGANRGRKLDVMRANPKVFFSMECEIVPFEGEVACKYGISYSSLMGKGTAEIIDDVENDLGIALGRAWFQAPEVDGACIVTYDLDDKNALEKIKPGKVISAKVLGVTGVDVNTVFLN